MLPVLVPIFDAFVAMSTESEALRTVSASVAKVFTEAETVFSSTSVAKVSSKEALNSNS